MNNYEQYKEIRRAIYDCFNYVIDMLEIYKYFDKSVDDVVRNISKVRNDIDDVICNSNDKNEVLDIIKNKAPQELRRFQKIFNDKYASDYLVRDCFNISKIDLSNALSWFKRNLNENKSKLKDYIRSKSGNDHFRYPVKRANMEIENIEKDIADMESKYQDFSQLKTNKKNVQGFEILDIEVNKKCFRYLSGIKRFYDNHQSMLKSVISSLPQ